MLIQSNHNAKAQRGFIATTNAKNSKARYNKILILRLISRLISRLTSGAQEIKKQDFGEKTTSRLWRLKQSRD